MNLEDIMLSEISQLQRDNTLWFHFYEVSRIVKFRKRKWNDGCQALEVGNNGKLLFNGYKVSVWEDKEVQKIYGGAGCKSELPNATELDLKMVNFYIMYIPPFFKKWEWSLYMNMD